MNLAELNPGDEKLGLMVWFRVHGIKGKIIPGKIKSWNDEYIFVVFNCDNNWGNWMNYTAEACYPQDLVLYAAELQPSNLIPGPPK